jgi:hypothetical protein
MAVLLYFHRFDLLKYLDRNQTKAHHQVPSIPKIFHHSFLHPLCQEFHLMFIQFLSLVLFYCFKDLYLKAAFKYFFDKL